MRSLGQAPGVGVVSMRQLVCEICCCGSGIADVERCSSKHAVRLGPHGLLRRCRTHRPTRRRLALLTALPAPRHIPVPPRSEVPPFGPAANALLDQLASSFTVEDAQAVRAAWCGAHAWARVGTRRACVSAVWHVCGRTCVCVCAFGPTTWPPAGCPPPCCLLLLGCFVVPHDLPHWSQTSSAINPTHAPEMPACLPACLCR